MAINIAVLLWLKPAWANLRERWDGIGPEFRFRKWVSAVLLLLGPPSVVVGTVLLLEYASFPQHSNLWIVSVALLAGGFLAVILASRIWVSAQRASELRRTASHGSP